MNRRSSLFLAAGLIPALFCRFTVRDVAYVDLGDEGYRLYGFIADPDETDLDERFERLATAILLDSNIEARLLDPDGELPEDGAEILRALEIQEFPVAVLVGPDGALLEVPLTEDGDPGELAGERVSALIDSPARRRFSSSAVENYCTVLLVSGGDQARDEAARAAVEAAFEQLRGVWDRMPKDVGRPPKLLQVGEPATERVLLWSLGIEAERDGSPAVAVLFGRGRRIGPVLEGSAITETALFGILNAAGQSCECELDRSWMRGPRIPLRWDNDLKARAVAFLGFDPENPRIKSEISGILSRGPSADAGSDPLREGLTIEEMLMAYSEESVVGPLSDEQAEVRSIGESAEPADQAPPRGLSVWARIAVALGVALLASLATGAFLILRNRRA